MTNLEKMIELSGHEGSTKEEVMSWARMNGVMLNCLDFETPFESMAESVSHYCNEHGYYNDEDENWSGFLDAEYVEGEEQ